MNRTIKGALFGLIGGTAGTFVIGKAVPALAKLQSREDKKVEKKLMPEPSTERLARISGEKLGVELTDERRAAIGGAIHWTYGILWGGVYGILRKKYPAVSRAGGLPFGVAFALFGEELMFPLMKVSPALHVYPASVAVRDLAGHYAYAAALEGTCRVLEAVEQAVSPQPLRTNPELRRVS
jgi:uncharacterized membrane protein YagU involved in acid resistance